MRTSRLRRVTLGLALALAATAARSAESPAQKALSQFAEAYCLKCHDSITQKGDRDFETFKLPLATHADLITAKDIIDQLTLREMPPHKSKEQPTDDERLAIIRLLREGIAATRGKIENSAARTVMRRLSNREYEN